MKKSLLIISTLLLAVLACNSVLPQTAPTQPALPTLAQPQSQSGQNNLPQTEADVPRVSVEDAKVAVDNGEAIIVDVRSAEVYAEGHIAGAILIPLGEFENNIADVTLDKDQWIITYCT